MERKVAVVMCRGDARKSAAFAFRYDGPAELPQRGFWPEMGTRLAAIAAWAGGDCEKACPFGAIHVNEEIGWRWWMKRRAAGAAYVSASCPRGVLAADAGGASPCTACVPRWNAARWCADNCSAGCLGCGKCERSCKFGALKLVNLLPEIDLSKCVGCMCCADNCPTGALKANEALRRHAVIRYGECIGCGACEAACQFGAIAGTAGQPHSVIEWNCVGCGACESACPQHCVQMVKNTN